MFANEAAASAARGERAHETELKTLRLAADTRDAGSSPFMVSDAQIRQNALAAASSGDTGPNMNQQFQMNNLSNQIDSALSKGHIRTAKVLQDRMDSINNMEMEGQKLRVGADLRGREMASAANINAADNASRLQIAQMSMDSDLSKQSLANQAEQAKLGFNVAKAQHSEGLTAQKQADVRNKNIIDNINELNKTGMATPRDRYRSTKQLGGPQAINFDTFRLFHSDDPTLNEIATKDDLAAFLMESGYPKDDFNRIMATSTLQ
jgi:hypothetical protein